MAEDQKEDAVEVTVSEPVTWVAYCTTCGEVLEECPNGGIVTGMAKRHKIHRPSHEMLVGFRIELDE